MAKSTNKFSFSNFINFMNEHFSLIIILLIVLVLGFLGGSLWTENQMLKSDGIAGKQDQAAAEGEVAETGSDEMILDNIPDLNDSDHVLGAKNADVVVITYADFQCSFCQRWHPTFNALVEKYGEKVTFVYRHFPLGFSYSEKLTQTSECVAKDAGEAAFWKFSDTIYTKLADQSIFTVKDGNSIITDESLLTIAANSGASISNIKTCLENKETASKIEEMRAGAESAGIGGTPATVIISKKSGREFVAGALPIEEVEALLEKHL